MTFSRVKPGTWAVNEELTSAQMNSLDIDHARAVDKAGDTLTGVISANGFGKVSADIHDSIVSSVDSGISTTAARGISINNDTGLSLEGATCWPSFRTGRSYQRVYAFRPITGTGASWSLSGIHLIAPGISSEASFDIEPHHGSTLTTIDVVLSVQTTHSAVPANLPYIRVRRERNTDLSLVGSAPVGFDDLYSGVAANFPTPASGAAWYASGHLQYWTITCDQNNVVDNTKYRYFVSVNDENGANAIAGNTYYGMRVTYTAITNMQFR